MVEKCTHLLLIRVNTEDICISACFHFLVCPEKFPDVTGMSLWRRTNSEDTNRDWEGYFQYLYRDIDNVPRESPESPVRRTAGAENFARVCTLANLS